MLARERILTPVSFADQLLAASEDESLSPADLRALLRRAALRLRELAPATDDEAQAFHDDARADAGMDEDAETKGSA